MGKAIIKFEDDPFDILRKKCNVTGDRYCTYHTTSSQTVTVLNQYVYSICPLTDGKSPEDCLLRCEHSTETIMTEWKEREKELLREKAELEFILAVNNQNYKMSVELRNINNELSEFPRTHYEIARRAGLEYEQKQKEFENRKFNKESEN